MASDLSRRRLGVLAAAAGSTLLGGCVTTKLTVETPGIEQSRVFASVSRTESWATSSTRVDVTLTEQATRELGVEKLVVLSGGRSYDTAELQPTATSATLAIPTTGRVTIVAIDDEGTVVDRQQVRVAGSRFP
ncbi:hypothetical protein [Haloarchaeobius sp. DT45]|uniref:hypothetical protein n=1 Tax=Haloarchaeobius sp. DT45 TaxID=3446116 RepID=UPI003F6AB62A